MFSPHASSMYKSKDGIQVFSVMCALLDLEFFLDNVFRKLDEKTVICYWPQEKIQEEVRRAVSSGLQAKAKHLELSVSILPFYWYVVVTDEDQSVQVFVRIDLKKNIPDLFECVTGSIHNIDIVEHFGLPIFSFCYR